MAAGRTPEGKVKLRLDDAHMKRGWKKARKDADAYVKHVNKGFKLVALAGVAAFGAITAASIKLAATQERADKLLAQSVASTKMAAGLSVQALKDMAAEFQTVTRYGDEAIQRTQSLLLSFTNIAGEQFRGTLEATMDLAVVMDGDMKSAAIQLGKALNDPVANLSALSRSGIQFTATQKATIKTLWEMGDKAAAQNLILKELNTQFGGQAQADAATYGGRVQQLKNVLGDLGEKIGNVLLPALTKTVVQITAFVKANEEQVVGLFKKVFEGLEQMIGVGKETFEWMKKNDETIRGVGVGLSLMTTAIYGAVTAQRVLNLAMKMNWVGFLIALATALIIKLSIMVEKTIGWARVWEWVKKAAADTFEFLKLGLVTLVEIVKKSSELMKAIFSATWKMMAQPWKSKEIYNTLASEMQLILGDLQTSIADKMGYVWDPVAENFVKEMDEIIITAERKGKEVADVLAAAAAGDPAGRFGARERDGTGLGELGGPIDETSLEIENLGNKTLEVWDLISSGGIAAYQSVFNVASRLMELENKGRLKGLAVAKYAFKMISASFLGEISRQAASKALFYAAEALGLKAMLMGPLGAGAAWAASLKFGAIAVGAGVGAAAIGSSAQSDYESFQSSSDGGHGGSSGGGLYGGTTVPIRSDQSSSSSITVNIHHDGAVAYGADGLEDMADRQIVPAIQRAVSDGRIRLES